MVPHVTIIAPISFPCLWFIAEAVVRGSSSSPALTLLLAGFFFSFTSTFPFSFPCHFPPQPLLSAIFLLSSASFCPQQSFRPQFRPLLLVVFWHWICTILSLIVDRKRRAFLLLLPRVLAVRVAAASLLLGLRLALFLSLLAFSSFWRVFSASSPARGFPRRAAHSDALRASWIQIVGWAFISSSELVYRVLCCFFFIFILLVSFSSFLFLPPSPLPLLIQTQSSFSSLFFLFVFLGIDPRPALGSRVNEVVQSVRFRYFRSDFRSGPRYFRFDLPRHFLDVCTAYLAGVS